MTIRRSSLSIHRNHLLLSFSDILRSLMKTAVLTGIRRMELVERPVPAITKDTDVLIRMKVVGVCGSDIHYYTTGRIGSQVVSYPFAVGHEGAEVSPA
jgi:L-iditol 2-dehydrogenase